MKVTTKSIFIPKSEITLDSIANIQTYYDSKIDSKKSDKPIRFVITKTDSKGYYCEIDSIVNEETDDSKKWPVNNILNFRKREYENTDNFNAVMIIPTGVGAEIGGHCGDGNAAARLIASACDTLITHPNVVNASDINEMTANTLYVEGSIITRLLMGQIGLQKVRSNRVLMLMDQHEDSYFNKEVVNAVSSARVTLGLDCDVVEMDEIAQSQSVYSDSGRAVGEISHLEKLLNIVEEYNNEYDAIAISSFIRVPHEFHKKYFSENEEMVNPWGGIEAMLTHSVAEVFKIPCAHSPLMTSRDVMNFTSGIVDPRKAPESASITYLHCILKGLYKSPRITSYEKGLNVEDISCLVIPDKCLGLPTLACLEQGIPVIAVRENKNIMENDLAELPFSHNKLFIVDNYLEAVGVMNALKAGISIESVRRPINKTVYLKGCKK